MYVKLKKIPIDCFYTTINREQCMGLKHKKSTVRKMQKSKITYSAQSIKYIFHKKHKIIREDPHCFSYDISSRPLRQFISPPPFIMLFLPPLTKYPSAKKPFFSEF